MGLDNPIHVALLVVLLLLVFGAKRIPEIGRSLGGGLREFKQSINGEHPADSQEQQKPTLNAGNPQAPAQAPAQTSSVVQGEPAATDQR
jgi:sec-independent protein translocase protein TatA